MRTRDKAIGGYMRRNIHVTCHKGRIHLRGIHVTIYMCIFDKFMNPFANFATCWTKVIQAYKLLYGGCILLKKMCSIVRWLDSPVCINLEIQKLQMLIFLVTSSGLIISNFSPLTIGIQNFM